MTSFLQSGTGASVIQDDWNSWAKAGNFTSPELDIIQQRLWCCGYDSPLDNAIRNCSFGTCLLILLRGPAVGTDLLILYCRSLHGCQ